MPSEPELLPGFFVFIMKLSEWFIIGGEPFQYYPGFTRRFGISVNACVLLSHVAWKTIPDTDGWISLNVDGIEKATGLSVKEQSTAREALVSAGLLEEYYARLDHKLRMRVAGKELEDGQPIENGHTPKGQMAISPNAERADGHTPKGQMAIRQNGVSTKGEVIGKEKEGMQAPAGDSECRPPDLASQAEQVYRCYPKKVAKPKALKAIAKQIKTYGLKAVLNPTLEFAKLWLGAMNTDSWQYCPHPASWYNAEKFNDSPDTWNRPNGGSGNKRDVRGVQIQPIVEQDDGALSANNVHQEAVELVIKVWNGAYSNRFGMPYVMDGDGKDAAAIDALLSAGWKADKIAEVARKAWDVTSGAGREDRCWACFKYSKKIRDFGKFAADIISQLDSESHHKCF